MPPIKLSRLSYDYIKYRKRRGEHQTLDSAIRQILDEADSDWREDTRDYRDKNGSGTNSADE